MNRSVDDFAKVITVGDMATIMGLLESNLGISFMYHALLPQQLEQHRLKELHLADFTITRTLSMVFQKQSYYEKQYQQLAAVIKQILAHQ